MLVIELSRGSSSVRRLCNVRVEEGQGLVLDPVLLFRPIEYVLGISLQLGGSTVLHRRGPIRMNVRHVQNASLRGKVPLLQHEQVHQP